RRPALRPARDRSAQAQEAARRPDPPAAGGFLPLACGRGCARRTALIRPIWELSPGAGESLAHAPTHRTDAGPRRLAAAARRSGARYAAARTGARYWRFVRGTRVPLPAAADRLVPAERACAALAAAA